MEEPNAILDSYSVVELGKLEGSLAGILAGFALTVSILLIERHPLDHSGQPPRLVRLSVVSFLVAFVASLATAFNFMVIGAERFNTARLAIQYIPTSFALSQSYVYFFLGIALALFEYQLAQSMRGFIGVMCGAALVMVGANMAFSTLWSVAVWENVKLSNLMDGTPLLWMLLLPALAPAFLVGVRITWPGSWIPRRWRLYSGSWRERCYIKNATVCLVLITGSSIVASFMSEDVPAIMRSYMRHSAVLTVALYTVVGVAAVLFLPRRVILPTVKSATGGDDTR